jgi:hypothetical protein
MGSADRPGPTAGSPSSAASVAGSAEPSPSRQPFRPFADGHWVAILLYALVVLLWIVLAAESAYQREWGNFTGYTCVALFFLAVPTGVMKRLGRTLKARKPPGPPSSSG